MCSRDSSINRFLRMYHFGYDLAKQRDDHRGQLDKLLPYFATAGVLRGCLTGVHPVRSTP